MWKSRWQKDSYEVAPRDAGTIAIIGSVVSIASGVKGLFASAPKVPEVPEPVVAPVPDDQAVAARARREAARRSQTSGSVSTILSGGGSGILGA